ncbi:uncharacterized protein LOC115321463 [Ixodes scapularis]|uniref:uncharacterized protein LOC115321463 n=1 Tax=Ixodes scapularis TaxID=6945 RepID=UPI001A9F2F12|nr:uncharacterized protein LOC115321463 [Ixodes scapularis]
MHRECELPLTMSREPAIALWEKCIKDEEYHRGHHPPSLSTTVEEAEIMAATFVSSIKVVFLLAFCFAVIRRTNGATGPQHTCAYPQTCTDPGENDPNHIVTSTAQYNPTTGQCETIPSETGPHNCQKFATLADCETNCGNAGQ